MRRTDFSEADLSGAWFGEFDMNLQLRSYPVHSINFAPDCTLILAGDSQNNLKIWDVATQKCIATLRGHNAPVIAVAWSKDGSRLASADAAHQLKIWEF